MRRSSITLLLGVLLAACGGGGKPQYVTSPVERGDIAVTVSANGTLNPVTLVNVGTQVSGTVRTLKVDFNSRVRVGEVLADLDDRTYRAALHQSEASQSAAMAALDLARANLARVVSLEGQGYVSKQDLDSAQQQLKSAVAQQQLTAAQVDRDRTNLEYTTIRSPVSGVVVSREIDVGQTVAASFQTPTLFKIAQDLKQMQIDSSFAEADVGRIRVGQSVSFTVDAFPDRTFVGEVRQIRLNPTTVQNVVTYDVVISVSNDDEKLLPGMTAYVNVLLDERKSVLKIPNSALRYRPPTPVAAPKSAGGRATRTIYVLRDGAPVPESVTVGMTDRQSIEILGGGLKPGDLVVTGTKTGGDASSGPRMRMF